MGSNVQLAAQFTSKLTRWGEKAMNPKLHAKLFVQESASRLGRYVVMGTPVRTGLARGNWRLSFIGRAGAGTLKTLDPTGSIATARIAASARSLAARSNFTLYNNLPYIVRLEHGWSKQAPNGMLSLSIARIRSDQTAIQREVEQKLKREVAQIGV